MRARKAPYIYPSETQRLEGGIDGGSRPPFAFDSVTSRVFPLRANMARLTEFCDRYLNMDIPPEIVHFRPAVPYVYLMVLNYGSLSPNTIKAQNLGWVAQKEITFTVPLEQWQKEHGRFVFKNWACVSPWIFVDDELSLTTGREVYGWPKSYANMETAPTLWSQDPRADSRIFTMKTNIFPKLYAGDRERELVLMEVDLASRPRYAEFPPSPNNPWSPTSILSTAAEGSLRLMQDMTDVLLGLPIRGYRSDRSPETVLRMMGTMGENLREFFPSFLWPVICRNRPQRGDSDSQVVINHITLKQFRDAERPEKACCQALVTSPMGFNRLNAYGLLGDLYLLRGDPSGGYTIRLYRYPAQPIVECLGLEVETTERIPRQNTSLGRHEGASSSDHTEVALLKPTIPFWTDVDLYYGKGRTLCSWSYFEEHCHAGKWSHWLDERLPWQSPTHDAISAHARTPRKTGHSTLPSYNTLQGAAVQPITGPFKFPDITLQVYPLLADRQALRAFLDDYVNTPLKTMQEPRFRLEPFGSYVYMVITACDQQYGTMWSDTNNIGWWADKDVSFYVPVKVYQEGAGNASDLLTLALVCPFAYSNSDRAVISDREVNGRPSMKADIECPEDAWLGPRGPKTCRQMVVVKTEVFPALNLGQRSEQRVLLELSGRDAADASDDSLWRLVMEDWAERKIQEMIRFSKERSAPTTKAQYETAEALAFELFAPGQPINLIYLKQYRDTEDSEKVCYQAYVNGYKTVHGIYEIREIDDPVFIRLHKYPSHPIRETFKLACKRMDSEGDGIVYVLEPHRPFWMRLQLNEELGRVVSFRHNAGEWMRGADSHPWVSIAPSGRWCKRHKDDAYFRSAYGKAAVGPDLLDKVKQQSSRRSTKESPDDREPQVKGPADAWLRAALIDDLRHIDRADLAVAKLSHETRELLRHHRWNLNLLAHEPSTEGLYWIVEELLYALGHDCFNPTSLKTRRFTRREARYCIESLDDIQVLIDIVLDENCLE